MEVLGMDIKNSKVIGLIFKKKKIFTSLIIVFLLSTAMLILIEVVHESGHLLISKYFNLDIKAHINLIMLGAYITLPHEFNSMELYKRIAVYAAGSLFNIFSGIIILAIIGVRNKIKISEAIKESLKLAKSLIILDSVMIKITKNKYINHQKAGIFQELLILFSLASIIIGIANLFPIISLDGGNIFFETLKHFNLHLNMEQSILISIINLYIIKRKFIIKNIIIYNHSVKSP
jgi:membrane-associated protease RseP (regulator of RpoE activity)